MPEHALLFTDVVDSTRLVEQLGDAAASRLWAEHDRRARDLLALHGGREIDRTDGFFLLFDHAGAAAAYALAYHAMLADLALRARAGLHVGTVQLRATPAEHVARGAKPLEVEGLAKPLAARVMSLALGGQTLLSATAHDALDAQPLDGAALERHGYYRLKGVESPVEIFEVGRRGVAPFSPPPDGDKAYQVVEIDGLWRPLREVRHNLPAERDAFIGRQTELQRLAARLDAGARLLSVVGPGGAGKTRLVRRYGWTWMGDWPGGVYFCDLSECRSLDAIWFAVAAALQVPLGRDDPAVQLGHAIAGRGRCLVVLDNFEQVIEHAGTSVGRWLDRADRAAFVVTSRERLRLNGEELLLLDPLPLATDSVELFGQRAQAQRPDFAVTPTNRATVAEIVRLVDGLPLAIELAAARIAVLSPTQLLERLEDRFRILAGTRGAAARQATLRNAIDWSWSLLAAWEQGAMVQCSVFEGGFDLAAAEAVLDLNEWPEAPPILDVVQSLVDKSLLRTWLPLEQPRLELEEPHFGMYVSIREYAREKLHQLGTPVERAAEDRHGDHFSTFGTDDAIEALSRHHGGRRRQALMLEVDNLVAGCRRAIGHGRTDAAVASFRAAWEVLDLQGPVTLANELASALLAMPGLEGRPLLVALTTAALALQRAGRTDEARACLERGLVLALELPDRRWEGRLLGQRATLQRDQGRVDQALQDFNAGLALHRETADRRAEGAILGNLGNLYLEQGRMAKRASVTRRR